MGVVVVVVADVITSTRGDGVVVFTVDVALVWVFTVDGAGDLGFVVVVCCCCCC